MKIGLIDCDSHNFPSLPLMKLSAYHKLCGDSVEWWTLFGGYDSPVSFRADGHTVRDFDRRFQMEDEGILIPGDRKFKWAMVDGRGDVQLKLF